MSAVFGSYDGQLENTSSMSDVADVFRTHCCKMKGSKAGTLQRARGSKGG